MYAILPAMHVANAAGPDSNASCSCCRDQLFRKVFDVVDKHPLFMEVPLSISI